MIAPLAAEYASKFSKGVTAGVAYAVGGVPHLYSYGHEHTHGGGAESSKEDIGTGRGREQSNSWTKAVLKAAAQA